MNESWVYNSAAFIGRSHMKKGIPCQDYTLEKTANGVYVIALSDGCSSSPLAHFGAEITVNTICDLFCEYFDDVYQNENGLEVKKWIVQTIVEQLDVYKESNHCKPDDLNATLIFVAIKDNRVILGRLGDGVIGAIRNNRLEIVSIENKTGEKNGTYYPTNLVNCDKPSLFNMFDLKKSLLNDISGFILMSDGAADSLVDARVPFIRKFAPAVTKLFLAVQNYDRIHSYQMLVNFLERSITKKTNDDCSIAVICRKDADIQEIIEYHLKKTTNRQDENIDELIKTKLEDVSINNESYRILSEKDPNVQNLLIHVNRKGLNIEVLYKIINLFIGSKTLTKKEIERHFEMTSSEAFNYITDLYDFGLIVRADETIPPSYRINPILLF